MSRAEKKLAKLKAEEELKKIKAEKRQKQQQDWDSTPKAVKVISFIIVGLLFVWIVSLFTGAGNDSSNSNSTTSNNLAVEVTKALDALGEDMKSSLASTSPSGYQGDIISVEPAAGNDTVKVNVSTYFEDSGDGINGGQNIARKIFSNVCIDVPELGSLYVISSSRLESKSVYRSQIPGCKQQS